MELEAAIDVMQIKLANQTEASTLISNSGSRFVTENLEISHSTNDLNIQNFGIILAPTDSTQS